MAGCRRLWALITNLPADSAVKRDGKDWTLDHELAAVSIEQTSYWGRMAAQPHYQHPDRLPAPVVFQHPDRPSPAPKRRKPSNKQELARALGLRG